MNLFDAARILGITDNRLAEKMGITPRALGYRKAKSGEYATVDVSQCPRTVDLFTGRSLRDEAREQFDYLYFDFCHRTGRRRKSK